jgi:hypothetical protein
MKGLLLDRHGSNLILFDIIMFYDTRLCFLCADALASGGHSGYLAAAETLTPGMNHDWVDIDYRLPSAAHVHILKRMLKKHFFNFVRTYVSQFRKQLTTSATPKELFEQPVLHETRR